MIVNNTLIDTDDGKANAFGNKLSKTFNNQQDDSTNFNQIHFDYVEKFFDQELYKNEYIDKEPQLITMMEIDKSIAKCKNKPSTDIIGLSNLILKQFPFKIKIIILKLFNICLVENYIPRKLYMNGKNQ